MWGKMGMNWEGRGRRNHNQDTLHEKKSIFNKKCEGHAIHTLHYE